MVNLVDHMADLSNTGEDNWYYMSMQQNVVTGAGAMEPSVGLTAYGIPLDS